jgi:hypothetical protein
MSMGIRTPGPIHHFVAFRTASGTTQGYYLGTAVAAPEQDNEKAKIPVMNDLGGRSIPFQLVQDGEKWLVTTTLNRFDLGLCRSIRALEDGTFPVPAPINSPSNSPGSVPGTEGAIARGTLVLGITDFVLVLVNGYAGTNSSGQFVGGIGSSDLAVARTFYSANLRTYKESTVGTRILEVAMAIECLPIFDQTSRRFATYAEGPPAIVLDPIT